MRPWNATHWKFGPSLWAKGPLKTVRMSAMLYMHTAEPLNTELRKWKAYFQWNTTVGKFAHNLKTHPGKIFCSCPAVWVDLLLRSPIPTQTSEVVWLILNHTAETQCKDTRNNTKFWEPKDLAVWLEPNYCSLTLQHEGLWLPPGWSFIF